MTLEQFIQKYKKELKEIASAVNCSVACVSNLRSMNRKPSHKMIEDFMHFSQGEIMPNDWFNVPPTFLKNKK